LVSPPQIEIFWRMRDMLDRSTSTGCSACRRPPCYRRVMCTGTAEISSWFAASPAWSAPLPTWQTKRREKPE
jgi:hypothetical protein